MSESSKKSYHQIQAEFTEWYEENEISLPYNHHVVLVEVFMSWLNINYEEVREYVNSKYGMSRRETMSETFEESRKQIDNMDLNEWSKDFDGKQSQVYKERCKWCGRLHKISTRRDNHPEYYTDIYLKCKCGESVHFKLPVN